MNFPNLGVWDTPTCRAGLPFGVGDQSLVVCLGFRIRCSRPQLRGLAIEGFRA